MSSWTPIAPSGDGCGREWCGSCQRGGSLRRILLGTCSGAFACLGLRCTRTTGPSRSPVKYCGSWSALKCWPVAAVSRRCPGVPGCPPPSPTAAAHTARHRPSGSSPPSSPHRRHHHVIGCLHRSALVGELGCWRAASWISLRVCPDGFFHSMRPLALRPRRTPAAVEGESNRWARVNRR
jgi:hypothetical protein